MPSKSHTGIDWGGAVDLAESSAKPAPGVARNPDPVDPSQEFNPTPDQIQAADPQFQRQHPDLAILNAYRPFDQTQRSTSYGIGNWLRTSPLVRSGLSMGDKIFDHGAGVGALAGGAGGYLAGMLGTKFLRMMGSNAPDLSIPLALAGAGAAGYVGHQRANPMNSSTAVKLGAVIAAMHHGVTPRELEQHLHVDAAIGRNPKARGEIAKMACRIAMDAFAQVGAKHELVYHLYEKMASIQNWNAVLQPYADAVLVSLARCQKFPVEEGLTADDIIKRSNAVSGVASAILRATGQNTPAAAQLMLGTSALAGVGGGALTWLANRHAREDSTDVEALKQKISYYNQLTDDIREELRARKIAPPVRREEPQ